MTLSIFICFAAFAWLLWILRRDRVSLGLPIAFLFSLLLIHVPGAFAHVVSDGFLPDSELTEIGIRFTAIGSVCFATGVWFALSSIQGIPIQCAPDREEFWMSCLIGGWFFTYGLSFLLHIPSLGAAVEKGGAIWMLGVLLGLRAAVHRRDLKWTVLWLGALAVYPVLMLLLGGFLSYGATVIIIVCSVLAISTRSHLRVALGVVVASVLSFHIFLSYFQNRDYIRDAVWGGAAIEERVDAATAVITDFAWFDPADERHLVSLHERLNQNHFAGLAAARIEQGQVDYLYGRSLWEGLISLVPRALWPEKPVFGGSPAIVREMTGLELSENTSWGVGNVMEFQINFGIPGLIVGFVLLGWLLGMLDRKAAAAEGRGDLGRVILFFLPGVALIQPNGSLVELTGGAAAALVAAYGWQWAWRQWAAHGAHPARVHGRDARRPL